MFQTVFGCCLPAYRVPGCPDGGPVKYRKDKHMLFSPWSEQERKQYPTGVWPLGVSDSPADDTVKRSITCLDDFFIAMRYVEDRLKEAGSREWARMGPCARPVQPCI